MRRIAAFLILTLCATTPVFAQEATRLIKEEMGAENVDATVGYIGMFPTNYPIQAIHQWTSGHGECLLKVALRELEYAIEEIRAAQGIFMSRIRVGNIPHSGTHLLSKAINHFLALYPAAFVHVLDGPYEPLLDGLRAGDLDLLFGVLRRPAWAIDVSEEFLFSNPYAVVVRRQHPLAGVRNVTLRDLAGYDWILPARGAPRREAFERLFAGSARAPIVSIETTSSAIYKSVLTTTDRIALLSTLEAQFMEPKALTIVPFQSPVLARADGVATRADWQPPRLHQQFLDLLRTQAQEYQTVIPIAPVQVP